MAEHVRQAAKETVGEKHIQSENVATKIGEDFAELMRRIPGAYYFLGTGNAAKGTDFEHHNSRFNIDEDSLPIGVEMHVRCALGYLSR
jgi:amidohydrolase